MVHVQKKERDCRIFHVGKSSASDLIGRRNSSHTNLVNELDDRERLKISEDEIKNIKKILNKLIKV